MAVVDILHTGIDPQSGGLEQAREPAVVAIEHLLIEQQGEAVFERQFLGAGLGQLLGEGGGHAGEPQGMEFIQSVLMQHGFSLFGSVVVVRAAYIAMQGKFLLGGFVLGQGLAIEPLLEDGADRAVVR